MTEEIHWREADNAPPAYIIEYAACSPAERDELLARLGLEIGQRYEHSRCPNNPTHQSHGAPVVVREHNILCWSCLSLGQGIISYSSLLKKRPAGADSRLANCVRHFCHLDHAAYVLAVEVPWFPERLQKPLFMAMLKTVHKHPADERRDQAFRPFPFVRGLQSWLYADTLAVVVPHIDKDVLRHLPAAKHLVEQDQGVEITVDPINVEVLYTDGNAPGYPALIPRLGVPIHGHYLPIENDSPETIRVLARKQPDLPRYLPADKQMTLEQIDAVLQKKFPGILINYLLLIIAAKGIAESGTGMLPIIIVIGPTGSAKTNTVKIACGLIGEVEFSLTSQKNDNFGEGLGTGAITSSIILIDEVFKRDTYTWEHQLRPLVLSLGRYYTFRAPYSPTRTIPFTSAIIIADTKLPDEVRDDEQLGRRGVYARLTKRVPDWSKIGADFYLWWKESDETRCAASSLISHVIDRWFAPGCTPEFQKIAAELGYATLEASVGDTEEAQRLKELRRAVFFAVCDPSTPTVPDELRLGKGWKECPYDHVGPHPIGDAVRALYQEHAMTINAVPKMMAWADGRWHELVSAKAPGRFEMKKHGGKRYVRFCDGKGKNIIVNEALLPDGYVPLPVPPAPPSAPLPTSIPSLVATIMTEMSKP